MTKDEKAIYTAGGVIAVVCAVGLASISYVLYNQIKRVETVVNTLPERMVKAVRGAVGI